MYKKILTISFIVYDETHFIQTMTAFNWALSMEVWINIPTSFIKIFKFSWVIQPRYMYYTYWQSANQQTLYLYFYSMYQNLNSNAKLEIEQSIKNNLIASLSQQSKYSNSCTIALNYLHWSTLQRVNL